MRLYYYYSFCNVYATCEVVESVRFSVESSVELKAGAECYKDDFPRGSNGNSNAMTPAATMSAPAIYTGTDVCKFAYRAIMGACSQNH